MGDDGPLSISESDFNTWKHHPVTKAFRKYLADFVGELERAHTERWRLGKADEGFEQWASGQVSGIEEIAGLEFEHIAKFYQQPEDENDSNDA